MPDPVTLQSFLDNIMFCGQQSINVQLAHHEHGIEIKLFQDGSDEPARFVVIEDTVLPAEEAAAYALNNNPMTRRDVYRLIDGERAYQDKKWADCEDGHEKSVGEFLTLIRHHSRLADEAYSKSDSNDDARSSVRKIAALATHCIEVNGAPQRELPKPAVAPSQETTWEFDPDYIPTAEDVFQCLKSFHEEHGLGIYFDTNDIARKLKCDPALLFNRDTEAGPLYKMLESGQVCGDRGYCSVSWALRGRMEFGDF